MARKRHKTRTTGRRWAAVGAMAAYGAAQTVQPLRAQDLPKSPNSDRRTSVDPARAKLVSRFEIAAGRLDAVLGVFAPAAGLHVLYAEDGIRALYSPGVSGLFTTAQALDVLLAGSGVVYQVMTPGVVMLRLAAVSSRVEVNSAADQVNSPKFPQPLLKTPQSVDVVAKEILQKQGVTTLRDALRNFAGISLAAGEGGAQGDNLTIRGFSARNDLFLDGMRDFGSYYRDPFNVEQVDVLQGPASVNFGRGSTGGVVNQETKSPELDRFVSGGLQFGTNAIRRTVIDVNAPVPGIGAGSAFRLNVMGTIGDVAGRDVAKNRRFGIAPSLALGLGTANRLTMSYLHQTADDIPDYGIPWLLNGPAPVNRANYYGFKDGNFLRTYDDVGTLRAERDVTSSLTLRDQLRYNHAIRNVLITEPLAAGPALVNRHEIGAYSTESSLNDQLDVNAQFKTGLIRHSVTSGIELTRETSDPVRPTYSGVPGTSLFAPDPSQVLSGTATITSKVRTTAVSESAYVLDTMKLSRRWELAAGVRFDRMDTSYRTTLPAVSHFGRVDYMPSWRASLSYSPTEASSLYFAAGDSFNPSAESLSLTAGSANVGPEKNLSYEAGLKWDAAQHRLGLRTAVFRTEKTNTRETDPANALLVVVAGDQRVEGVEAGVTGRITTRWQMLAGYALLDSRVVSSKYYPNAIGFPLANVPRNTANLWTFYDSRWRHVGVGGGLNFVDARTASSTAPLDAVTRLPRQVPGYWTFNAMASFPASERIEVQINGNNLTNRYYYDELHPAHIIPGEGRTALIGINFKF